MFLKLRLKRTPYRKFKNPYVILIGSHFVSKKQVDVWFVCDSRTTSFHTLRGARPRIGLKGSAELPNLEGNGGIVSGDKVAIPLRGN